MLKPLKYCSFFLFFSFFSNKYKHFTVQFTWSCALHHGMCWHLRCQGITNAREKKTFKSIKRKAPLRQLPHQLKPLIPPLIKTWLDPHNLHPSPSPGREQPTQLQVSHC